LGRQIEREYHGWGKLAFHVFGALAEFKRSIIRERTKAGL